MSDGKRRQQQPKRVRDRRITVRVVQRNPVDLNKLSRALIGLAQAEAEAAAKAEHEASTKTEESA